MRSVGGRRGNASGFGRCVRDAVDVRWKTLERGVENSVGEAGRAGRARWLEDDEIDSGHRAKESEQRKERIGAVCAALLVRKEDERALRLRFSVFADFAFCCG